MAKILITGGTGSLGKALTKNLIDDNEIYIYSRDEGKQAAFPYDVNKIIGDVRDRDRLDYVFHKIKPDIIYHTAALKRVPDMELYPDECVKTNILGSQNVAWAADKNNIGRCVLISTDKACQPVNVYGATKFAAERIFTNYNYHSDTMFCSVRYGNVIASRGSFIPLWIDDIQNDRQIQITDELCTRFLFTLNDAANFVISSVENAYGGEVFVPLMDSYTLNRVLLALKRMLNKDIDCKVIGMRPGEKLHEDMIAETEMSRCYKMGFAGYLSIHPEYYEVPHSREKYVDHTSINSRFFVKDDTEKLISLIQDGINQ